MAAKKKVDVDRLDDLFKTVTKAQRMLDGVLAKLSGRAGAKSSKLEKMYEGLRARKAAGKSKTTKKAEKGVKFAKNGSKTAKNGKKASKKTKFRAEIKGGAKRDYTIFTPEQKADQRKLIYQTVASNEKVVTTPEIIKKVTSKYPEINESVVRGIVKDLVAKKHLRMLQKERERTLHYAIGPEPF